MSDLPETNMLPLGSPSAVVDDLTRTKQPTLREYKDAMRIYFTVRNPIVKSCGHSLNLYSSPKRNCEACWFAFFQQHGEVVQTADKVFQEEGREMLDRLMGSKFRVAFLKFMSTMAQFKAAADTAAEKENNGQQSTRIVENGSGGDANDYRWGGAEGQAGIDGGQVEGFESSGAGTEQTVQNLDLSSQDGSAS